VDSGKDINVPGAVKTQTITRGLKYSLATGNWGQQGQQGLRSGVSQVRARVRASVCVRARVSASLCVFVFVHASAPVRVFAGY